MSGTGLAAVFTAAVLLAIAVTQTDNQRAQQLLAIGAIVFGVWAAASGVAHLASSSEAQRIDPVLPVRQMLRAAAAHAGRLSAWPPWEWDKVKVREWRNYYAPRIRDAIGPDTEAKFLHYADRAIALAEKEPPFSSDNPLAQAQKWLGTLADEVDESRLRKGFRGWRP